MAKQLMIDTSNRILAIGISEEDQVIDFVQMDAWQRQSEITLLEVNLLLTRNDWKLSQIEKVVIANGPGSYTGLRIALTIGKTLSYALNIPLIAISSLHAMCGVEGKKIALMDARGQRAYVGIYNQGQKVIEEKVLTISQIKLVLEEYPDFLVIGDAYLVGKENKEIQYIDNLAKLSLLYTPVESSFALKPVYLKD